MKEVLKIHSCLNLSVVLLVGRGMCFISAKSKKNDFFFFNLKCERVYSLKKFSGIQKIYHQN